jgi:RNA polymerase sigma-70 factor (ECF subfamily)
VSADKNAEPHGTDRADRRLQADARLHGSNRPVQLASERREEVQDEVDPARAPMLRAQRGDPHAFGELVEMFQARVLRVMGAVLRCDRGTAEDLAQEVFLRVYKGLPSFDGEVPFAAWLHRISMNVAITEHRRRKAQKRDRRTLSIDAPAPGSDDLYLTPEGSEREPADHAQRREFLAAVRRCVHELPDEYREAVILRDMESLSYEEIAVALDLAPGTVRSRIHRGRLLLQQKLKEFRP